MTDSPGWGAAGAAPGAATTRRHWAAYGVALIGVFMTLLDATIVNVAIVPIQRELHAGYDAVEWTLAGYALAFGLTVIPGGRLGDRFGHKRIFLIGLAGFTVASVLCAVSVSAGELIAWRVVEGAMAGLINPTILGLTEKMFAPADRGQAYAMYGATAGLASALGPLLGGLLIAWNLSGWDWRPVFMINVPLGVIAVAGVVLLAPEARGRGGSLDMIGIAAISVASFLLTYPLVEGQQHGWPAWSFLMLGLSVPAFAGFGLWEGWRLRRGAIPLVDIRLFRNRAFTAGVTLSMFFFAGFVGFLFAMSVHLQIGLGHSPLYSGLTLLPYAGGAFVSAAASDALTRLLGRGILFTGAGLEIAGLIAVIVTIRLVGPDPGVSALQLLPSMLVAGIGTGFIIAPSTNFVLATVPWQDTGAAGGALNCALRYGQALGVAIVGVVLFAGISAHAPASAAGSAASLRQQLAAAGVAAPRAEHAAGQFTTCFVAGARSADPTATPPGCQLGGAGTTGTAFTRASATALRDDYTHAMETATLYPLGALVVTFLLVFFMPKRTPDASEWAQGGNADWGSVGAGSGQWSAGADAQQGSGDSQWPAGSGKDAKS